MADDGKVPQNWAECHETDLSAVFVAGDRVLKLKKPVRMPFVDFTTLAARTVACEEEVRLNTRLSPDVYLGVVHIGLNNEGAGEPMVVMRRLHDEDQLESQLTAGAPDLALQMGEVARCLAVFHSECTVHDEQDCAGSWASVRRAWLRECDELDDLGDTVADRATRGALRTLGLTYLDGRRFLFDSRLRTGQVVEGHGDLRCEHIYLTADGVRILDCVEFDESLRIVDVVSDLAFLVMDLERLGAVECSTALLSSYQEFTGETFPRTLLDFFVAYRSIIRAKVRAIRIADVASSDPEIGLLIALAESHLRWASPIMLCVGGLPGSGKSSLSEGFSRAADAVYVSSDEIRHGLQAAEVGAADSELWEHGAYSPDMTDEVYRVLLGRAETALSEGCSVVMDASWRDAVQRDRAHALAIRCFATPVDVVCEIDENTARHRLARNRRGYSQAGLETRESMKAAFAPWPDARVLVTDREVSAVLPDLGAIVECVVDEHLTRGLGA